MDFSRNGFTAALFAMVVFVLMNSSLAVPIRNERDTSNTAEFTMDQTRHGSYDWYSQDPAMAALVSESERAFENVNMCPLTVTEGVNVPLYIKSTCPWYYTIDHVPSRFPATILVAKSACKECIGSNGQHECNPITRSITVLDQGAKDANGNFKYTEREMVIPVGFTCAGRNTVNNGAATSSGLDYA